MGKILFGLTEWLTWWSFGTFFDTFAIMYRMVAVIEGRTPPTTVPKDHRSRSSPAPPSGGMASGGVGGGFGSGSGGSVGGVETPLQRETRLRAEAAARLREKFGAGGLTGQAVGFTRGWSGRDWNWRVLAGQFIMLVLW